MLEKYHDELLSCTGCGFCKKPYFTLDFCRKESDFPKGKMMIAYGLLTGEIEEDDYVVRALQKCTLCRRCEEDCPSLIKIAEIIQAARHDLKHMLPPHEKLLANIEQHDNILGENNFEKDGGNTAFFMGCLTNKEMKNAVVSLFDKLGIDVTIIGGCCGHPAEKIGRTVEVKAREKLREKEIDRLIFSCPNGMCAFSAHNPVHISQFLITQDVTFRKGNETYIYHDPAFLGRHLGTYEEPRKIIKRIGNLVEFNENRELARWCGGEIEFVSAFPEEAEELALHLVREAKEKNATIVTASPHCYHHLKEYGDVIDLLQLVEEHIS